jgi:CHAD domain-containing protein
MPHSFTTRLSIAEIGARHGNEQAHAHRVSELALALFDATHGMFGIPADDRPILEAGCLLHDVGYGAHPRRHAEEGAEIVRREGIQGLAPSQVAWIAMLVRLHPASLRFAEARALAERIPEAPRILYAAALLRIADALDSAHVQDAEIVAVRAINRRVRVNVRCPQFPADVGLARLQASLWREAFPADVDIRLVQAGARPPLITSSLSLHEAVRRLLFVQYRTVLMNVDGALKGVGDEPLHDLRIAVRRMRTVWRALGKPLHLPAGDRIAGDLQQLNRVLGSARDLDVWIGFFSRESVSRQFTRHRLWKRFVAHQVELRRLQQVTVRRQLHGSSFNALDQRIGRFLRVELPAAAASAPPVTLDKPARRALLKNLRRALELGHLRKSRSAEKLHRLRRSLRRVRYLGGFLGEALGRPVRKLGRRTHALERLLGEMRDADLALSRIRQEGPTPPRLLVRQLERIRQANAARLESAWRRFEDPAFILEVRRQLK